MASYVRRGEGGYKGCFAPQHQHVTQHSTAFAHIHLLCVSYAFTLFTFFNMMLFVLLSAALCGTTFARPQAVSPTVLPIRFGTECYVYAPSQISEALASRCTAVVMQDFKVPKDQTLDLTRLPERMSFTFNGTTTFEPSEDPDFVAIRIGGIKPNIDAIPGSIIYGNGPLFWDGQGPKGGKPKYVPTQ